MLRAISYNGLLLHIICLLVWIHLTVSACKAVSVLAFGFLLKQVLAHPGLTSVFDLGPHLSLWLAALWRPVTTYNYEAVYLLPVCLLHCSARNLKTSVMQTSAQAKHSQTPDL